MTAQGLRELRVVNVRSITRLYDMVRDWSNRFNCIEYLVIEFFGTESIPFVRRLRNGRGKDMHKAVGDLNRALGVRGMLESVETCDYPVFFWKADKGHVLHCESL